MSIGITNFNTNLSKIDSSAIQQAANQIFQNAKTKENGNPFANIDFTKYTKATQGVDLYNSKVSIETTQQIAKINAGLDVQIQAQSYIANVQYLTNIAAQNAYTSKEVDGKIYIPQASKQDNQKSREVYPLPASSLIEESKDLNKDKEGSNPFAFISVSKNNNEDDEPKQNEEIKIF